MSPALTLCLVSVRRSPVSSLIVALTNVQLSSPSSGGAYELRWHAQGTVKVTITAAARRTSGLAAGRWTTAGVRRTGPEWVHPLSHATRPFTCEKLALDKGCSTV